MTFTGPYLHLRADRAPTEGGQTGSGRYKVCHFAGVAGGHHERLVLRRYTIGIWSRAMFTKVWCHMCN